MKVLVRLFLLYLLGAISAAAADGSAAPQTFQVTVEGMVGDNQLGIRPGEVFRTDFSMDPGLSAFNLAAQPVDPIIRFIDPWRWHWWVGNPWDWLRVFIIDIPIWRTLPDPPPNFSPLIQVRAFFDSADDMVMNMPGQPVQLERGSEFYTELHFKPEVGFDKEKRLPSIDEINNSFLLTAPGNSFSIRDATGREVLKGTITSVKGTVPEPACPGDLDGDGDVDATDARTFRTDFGRRNCPLM